MKKEERTGVKNEKKEIHGRIQGSQFTSSDYVEYLKGNRIRQSMDGKARWVDNVLIERWFCSLKCECIYINKFERRPLD